MMPMRSSSGGAVSIGHRTGPNGIYRDFIGWGRLDPSMFLLKEWQCMQGVLFFYRDDG